MHLFLRFLFVVGVLFALVAPALFIAFDKAQAAWLSLLSGIFVTVATRLDDLQEIKFGPLQARMREILKEATATLDQLKGIAKTNALVSKSTLITESFAFAAIPFPQRLAFKEAIDEQLKRIGLSEEEIASTDKIWEKGIALIYHRRIRSALNQSQLSLIPDAGTSFDELVDHRTWTVSSPDKIRQFAKNLGVLTPEAEKQIDEFAVYLKTGAIPNMESWHSE